MTVSFPSISNLKSTPKSKGAERGCVQGMDLVYWTSRGVNSVEVPPVEVSTTVLLAGSAAVCKGQDHAHAMGSYTALLASDPRGQQILRSQDSPASLGRYLWCLAWSRRIRKGRRLPVEVIVSRCISDTTGNLPKQEKGPGTRKSDVTTTAQHFN